MLSACPDALNPGATLNGGLLPVDILHADLKIPSVIVFLLCQSILLCGFGVVVAFQEERA